MATNGTHKRSAASGDPRNRYWKLKNKYGVSVVWYLAQFQHQDGKCAICKQASPGRALSVDHDHETGQVRELLCYNCNLVIGFAHEDEWRLGRAADYIRKH